MAGTADSIRGIPAGTSIAKLNRELHDYIGIHHLLNDATRYKKLCFNSQNEMPVSGSHRSRWQSFFQPRGSYS